MKEIKEISLFKDALCNALIMTVVLSGTSSCSNPQKQKKYNEAKFGNYENNEKDMQFLFHAAEFNLEGIHLALLAQQKCILIDVKELAKMMEKMHRNSLNSLTEVAAKKFVALPKSLADNGDCTYEYLTTKSGSNFDKEYCEMMVSGHAATISMFERQYEESNDPDIRQWVISTLPILRKHLNHATTCQKAYEKIL